MDSKRLKLVLKTYGATDKGIAWILNAMKPGEIEKITKKNKAAKAKRLAKLKS